jgi:hypothetical protein
MKMRKFLHILAVALSSLTALVTHAKAQESSQNDQNQKKGVTRHHRRHLDTDGDDSTHGAAARHHKASLDPDADVKNSHHAATWTSYTKQKKEEGPDAPAPKLNPALMATAEPASQIPVFQSSIAPAPLPGDEQSRYPWKREIVTTTFWIGETPTHNNPVPNDSSCWDPKWAHNYGGNDAPEAAQRTSDYIPATFTPSQNPFYIALPYNDMEHGQHKAEASQIIPWFSAEYKGPSRSVCQGRWIAIRYGSKVCYAQWEDAGPFRTDHYQYVFGTERPKPNLNQGAGLDVSPAVRDYLGMNGTDVTDWKFVDFDEVPSGPWAKFGENNTFVQNARKGGSEVAENIVDTRPASYHSIIPGEILPAERIR